MKPPGGRTPASIRSRLSEALEPQPYGSWADRAWRKVPQQIEPRTSTVRLRTAASLTSIALIPGLGPPDMGLRADRSAAVGVRSITSDHLQIRHHYYDRRRYEPNRAVHRLDYAASSKSWAAFVCGTIIASP